MADRVLIMGVVNVTPDSFSDGGRYLVADAAISHGLQLLRDGADVLDVGGEATNPKAAPTSAADELARVIPVIEALVAAGANVSVDTTKADVATAAIAAGARWVNDVSGGLFDPRMNAAIPHGISYICGHLRGRSIAEVFHDENREVTWCEVAAELGSRLAAFPPHVRATAWVDPGLGFGKGANPATNLELLRHAGDLGRAVGRPVMVGPSRKRFLHRWLELPDADEAALDRATVAACSEAVTAGAKMLRVHNVALLHTTLTAYNQ
ncbi:MAG: dihydropteroate synthase [Deltaproteobacteria bacterium]